MNFAYEKDQFLILSAWYLLDCTLGEAMDLAEILGGTAVLQ